MKFFYRITGQGLRLQMLALLAGMLLFTSCAELGRIAEGMGGERPLTEYEVINGLREALIIGSDSAATTLGRLDGYYGNPQLRIGLPPEAAVITNNLSYIPGGEALVQNVVQRINRAAEDAARQAAPVFRTAILNMTIRDGFEILRGENDAATNYLMNQTYDELYRLFRPRIQQSTEKELVGSISAADAWNTLTGQWNNVANSTVGRLAGFQAVDVDLDDYLTVQALNGLFTKLAEEEAKIRQEPAARVTALLRRVFGYAV